MARTVPRTQFGSDDARSPTRCPTSWKRNPLASSKGCGLEVEPARACSPYAPPALFTGTGALYDTPNFDLSTVVSPN